MAQPTLLRMAPARFLLTMVVLRQPSQEGANMELLLAFVGAAEAVAAQHEGTRFFDPDGVVPAISDEVEVMFLPAEERRVLVCRVRRWDLSQKGKTVLYVGLDLPQ
jgi:hypothetical protein